MDYYAYIELIRKVLGGAILKSSLSFLIFAVRKTSNYEIKEEKNYG